MTTPDKKQILERAKELWFQDRIRRGCIEATEINPEIEELREEGFIIAAQHSLMRNPYSNWVIKEKPTPQSQPLNIDIVNTILNECCFITGGRGSGKSNLAMLLTDLLLKNGVQVKVIDSSRQWLKKSSVPYFHKVEKPYESELFALYDMPNAWDCVYDCSRLSTLELRELVSGMMTQDFRECVELDEIGATPMAIYILEECQNLIPNGSLRRNDFQEVSRFVTQGRNFGLAYIAVSQRLASVDTSLVEISGLKYFGKLEGENNLRKAKAWLSKEWVKSLRDFKTGEFLMQYGSKVSLEKTPLFRTVRKPIEYIHKEPVTEKIGFWQKLSKALGVY